MNRIKREESNRLSVNIQMSTLNDTFNENQGDEKKLDYNYGDWINYGCFYFIALCLLFYLNFHRSFLFFKTCLRASVNIHDKLFCGITRASLKFFECNSTDKVLELFSTAIATIDYKLPQLFHDSIVVRKFQGLQSFRCNFICFSTDFSRVSCDVDCC
jgi:ABC transporter transmembrane region